jgi:hypothetical protein
LSSCTLRTYYLNYTTDLCNKPELVFALVKICANEQRKEVTRLAHLQNPAFVCADFDVPEDLDGYEDSIWYPSTEDVGTFPREAATSCSRR